MTESDWSSKTNISFAKIVATPTLTSWSQAYNAGNVFAVLSLKKEKGEGLSALGKEILNTLEEEYFTLEEKSLAAIKQAIDLTYKKVPEDTVCSFVVISIINNVLYAFTAEAGRVFIKRGAKMGHVLSGSEDKKNPLSSSSGYLENKDIIIIQTKEFGQVIDSDELTKSLDGLPPNEIAEILSPKIHEIQDGGAAAIIVSYQALKPKLEKEELEKPILAKDEPPSNRFHLPSLAGVRLPILSHSKRLLLSIAVIIIFILIASIYFAAKKQEDAKTKALFNKIYPVAQKKYDEGQSLLELNKNLARNSLTEAQKMLSEGKTKFKKDSNEEKQINELLKKTKETLVAASEINTIDAKETNASNSLLLSAEAKSSNTNYFYKDGNLIYSLNIDGVFADGKEKIKNKDFWKEPGGLGVYLGNIYVLDRKDGILKFVAGEAANKAGYFTGGANPDLSKATAIAIDGSIYILTSDGTILKFIRGKPEAFNVSGLDKPFSSPSRIYTNAEGKQIYILDNGNSRIVILDKNGAYISQYSAKILKTAKDFEVKEADKKIFILSQNKIWEIGIK